MINKLFRQSLKPIHRVLHEKAYKEWLGLFDFFKKENLKFPLDANAMGFQWKVHHGDTFLNQFESIFINQIYKFECKTKQPIIIDCGSNMGTSILYFKWLYADARIFAFEPDKQIFKVLESNVSNNNLSAIKLFNKAIWIDNKEMFFNSNHAQSGKIIVAPSEIKVQCVQLKEFMQDFDSIDFLKLDIEGAELPVLLDISSELFRVKHLFIEYHSALEEPQKLSQLLQALEKVGFRYFIGGSACKSPFINKTAEDGMDLTLDIFASKN